MAAATQNLLIFVLSSTQALKQQWRHFSEWLLWFQVGFFPSSKPISGNHPSIFVEKSGGVLWLCAPTSQTFPEVSSFFKNTKVSRPRKRDRNLPLPRSGRGRWAFFWVTWWFGSLETGCFPKNPNPGFCFVFFGGGGKLVIFMDPVFFNHEKWRRCFFFFVFWLKTCFRASSSLLRFQWKGR